MPGTDDIASLLTPPDGASLRFGSGKVISWNATDLSNVIEWRGGRLVNVNVAGDLNALTIEPGHVVAMLGWTTEGGFAVWWVIGRILSSQVGIGELFMRGGGMTLAGGTFRMTSTDGSTGLLYFGTIADGSRSWLFSHEDGSLAGGLLGSAGQKYWGWQDRASHVLLSNDSQTGIGLAKPYIPLRMVPSSEAQIFGTSFWPSHTSTSFVRLMSGFNPVFHPRVEIGVGATTAGGGSAEWRLVINGADVTGTVTGSGTRTVSIPDWGSSVLPGHTVEFQLQARVVGGGSNVLVQCDKFFALQS